jgi:hypothetical protein
MIFEGWVLRDGWWYGPQGERLRAISGGTGAEIAVLAVAAIAAAASAYGAYSAAESQQDALKAQAKAQEADAEAAAAAGQAAAANQRRKDRALQESFAARAAGAGVVAREGSSLLAELDFATNAEMEAQNVQYGYRLEERSKKYQAYLSKREAGKINPAMNAGISLLQSAGSIAGGFGGGAGASMTGGGLSAAGGLTGGGGGGTSSAAYQAYRAGERG